MRAMKGMRFGATVTVTAAEVSAFARSVQETAVEGSIITGGGDDPFILFALVCVACAGLFFVGRLLLQVQMRREARMRGAARMRRREVAELHAQSGDRG